MGANETRSMLQEGESVPAVLVLEQLAVGEPGTTAELADAVGLDEATTRSLCADLVERGDLRRKELRSQEATMTVWYRPAEGADSSPEARAERVIASLSVPGASEMMRDWRRDAVRAAYEFLREEGEATTENLVSSVYPAHSAGYNDEEPWWAMVAERLACLPGVSPPATDEDTEDETWTFDAQ
ncbi:helix-turn-helix domain-containing protein [Haloarchaeobius amylolyticus]|uniref:helix-turn-helix domain-containing protein n=1 Tax=Haloarchaeobius amylolyticus TaxID=1198296 RepID=UPI002271CBFC|nr:helix-turn-helix domain-containing protein [Haloarchaeobius amylolyticus]